MVQTSTEPHQADELRSLLLKRRQQRRRDIGKLRSTLAKIKANVANIIPDGSDEALLALEEQEEEVEACLEEAIEAERITDNEIQALITSPRTKGEPSPSLPPKKFERRPEFVPYQADQDGFDEDDRGSVIDNASNYSGYRKQITPAIISRLHLPFLSDPYLLKSHFMLLERLLSEAGAGDFSNSANLPNSTTTTGKLSSA